MYLCKYGLWKMAGSTQVLSRIYGACSVVLIDLPLHLSKVYHIELWPYKFMLIVWPIPTFLLFFLYMKPPIFEVKTPASSSIQHCMAMRSSYTNSRPCTQPFSYKSRTWANVFKSGKSSALSSPSILSHPKLGVK